MRYGERFTCLYCLAPDSYELRADTKGRPYFACVSCSAKTFLRGQQSLRGPSLLWKPLTTALLNDDVEAAKVLLNEAGKVSK